MDTSVCQLINDSEVWWKASYCKIFKEEEFFVFSFEQSLYGITRDNVNIWNQNMLNGKFQSWNYFLFVVTDKQQVVNIQRTNRQGKIANRQTALRQQADSR